MEIFSANHMDCEPPCLFRRISGLVLHRSSTRFRYTATVKERLPQVEIAPELIQAYAITFLNRFDCYPLQTEKGRYVRIRQPLTQNIIHSHLHGKLTIGTYALDMQSMGKL